MARNILLIAVAALLFSATGAGAAALIDGGDVVNGSLTGKDIQDKSLTKNDFHGSLRGPRGFQGEQGRPGEQGPAGAKGATASFDTTRVRMKMASSSGIYDAKANVECNDDETATGGGGSYTTSPQVPVSFWFSAASVNSAGRPNGWQVNAATERGDVTIYVTAYALCAK